MSSMHLYAELLQHIQSVTFFASLQSEHNHETKVQLSANNEWITLSHEGQNASMRLPTKIGGGGDAALTLPAAPSRDITLRLRLEETSPGLLQFRDHASGNIEPWTAEALGKDTEVYCCQCGQLFISRGRVQTWKDLPSENWAEMMDFWHCHKPANPSTDSPPAAHSKGYAAGNTIKPERGIGLVDTSSFLVSTDDCTSVKVRPPLFNRTAQAAVSRIDRKEATLGVSGSSHRVFSDTTIQEQISTLESRKPSGPRRFSLENQRPSPRHCRCRLPLLVRRCS